MHSKDTKRRRVFAGFNVVSCNDLYNFFCGDGSLLCDIFRGFFP